MAPYRITKRFSAGSAAPLIASRYRTVREYSALELPASAMNVRRIGP